MSALRQAFLHTSLDRPTELRALQEVGCIAWAATDADAGLEEIAAIVLQLPGIYRFELNGPGIPAVVRLLQAGPGAIGSAIEPVNANGKSWGDLRIHFDIRSVAVETPLKFTRFIAQQIALMLERLGLEAQLAKTEARIARLAKRIETRKAVHRARGILARERGISDAEALRVLSRHAHESRRPLFELAQAVIWGFEAASFERPRLRRLNGRELTSRPDRQWGAASA